MSWQEILEEGFKKEAKKERRTEGRDEGERKRLEDLRIARTLALRVKPVLQEFARRKGWGRVQEWEDKSQIGRICLECGQTEIWVEPLALTIGRVCMGDGTTYLAKLIAIPVGESIEELFAEALVETFL